MRVGLVIHLDSRGPKAGGQQPRHGPRIGELAVDRLPDSRNRKLCAQETSLATLYSPLDSGPTQGMRILVVDDQVELATIYRVWLEREGHEVQVFVDPRAALDALDERIDAVVSDLEMPFMDGAEMATHMRKLRPNLPIVFSTGSDPSIELHRRAQAIGPVVAKRGNFRASMDEILIALNEHTFVPRKYPRGLSPEL